MTGDSLERLIQNIARFLKSIQGGCVMADIKIRDLCAGNRGVAVMGEHREAALCAQGTLLLEEASRPRWKLKTVLKGPDLLEGSAQGIFRKRFQDVIDPVRLEASMA